MEGGSNYIYIYISATALQRVSVSSSSALPSALLHLASLCLLASLCSLSSALCPLASLCPLLSALCPPPGGGEVVEVVISRAARTQLPALLGVTRRYLACFA